MPLHFSLIQKVASIVGISPFVLIKRTRVLADSPKLLCMDRTGDLVYTVYYPIYAVYPIKQLRNPSAIAWLGNVIYIRTPSDTASGISEPANEQI